MQRFFQTTPPSVHSLVLTLERRGLIRRVPRQARSITLSVAPESLPPLETPPASPLQTIGRASQIITLDFDEPGNPVCDHATGRVVETQVVRDGLKRVRIEPNVCSGRRSSGGWTG
jgi:hypothetical protein